MGLLARLCVMLAAVGAVNWVVLAMFEKDMLTVTLGSNRTTGTDMARIVVGMAAIYALVTAFKKTRSN